MATRIHYRDRHYRPSLSQCYGGSGGRLRPCRSTMYLASCILETGKLEKIRLSISTEPTISRAFRNAQSPTYCKSCSNFSFLTSQYFTLTAVRSGNVAEQHSELFETFVIAGIMLVIQESWFLRPLFMAFGMSPVGPLEGSIVA
ncbi:hypothetical protein C8Q72DRAFT_812866 [Fomitopsis betulina]|nr:hypothetical protein C8Q72DRAFT_812866 [Fomitopsis betulina]